MLFPGPEIASRRVFTLAHVSDWHTTSLLGAPARALATKRFWGWQSWHRSRRQRHRPEVLAGLLRGLGTPDWVTVVPGNHDAYVRVDPGRGWDRWAPYLCSDGGRADRAPTPAEYPTVRVRGEVAVIGLCSALPTPLFMATGRLGTAQLERLERRLVELRGCTRVVALHHPPTDQQVGWRRRLGDWRALQDVLARAGAELVVHGHRHRRWVGHVDGPERAIPVAGVRSTSDVGKREERRAQYHLYRLAPGEPVRLEVRGYDPVSGNVVPEGEQVLDG